MPRTRIKPANNGTAKREAAKAAKFVELAEKRVTKAINSIRSISKLSARSNYVYTPDQVNRLCEVLKSEVLDMHKHFTAPSAAVKEVFKF